MTRIVEELSGVMRSIMLATTGTVKPDGRLGISLVHGYNRLNRLTVGRKNLC